MISGDFMPMPVPHLFWIDAFGPPFAFHWDEHFSFQGEKHDAWEIVYVLSGEVESTEDERVYHLKAGDMLFHAPQEFHKIRSCGQTRPHGYIFSFQSSGNLPESLKNGVIALSEEEQRTYKRLFDTARRIFHGTLTDPNECFLCCLELSAFFCRIAMGHKTQDKLSPSRPAQEYHKLVLAMMKCVCKNYTLQDFSTQCSVSISYMKDLFHRYAGMSPKAYYVKLRCEEATRLLQQGLTIQAVSERMNFSSPNYFSEFFKKQKGLPPAKYIREHMSE